MNCSLCPNPARVRGLCRKHARSDKPCIACRRCVQFSRKLCQRCFRQARLHIRSGKFTDEQLVKMKLLGPRPTHYFKPGGFTEALSKKRRPRAVAPQEPSAT